MDFVVSGYDSVKFRKTYHKNNTGQRLIGHTDASFHENVCNVLFRQYCRNNKESLPEAELQVSSCAEDRKLCDAEDSPAVRHESDSLDLPCRVGELPERTILAYRRIRKRSSISVHFRP